MRDFDQTSNNGNVPSVNFYADGTLLGIDKYADLLYNILYVFIFIFI